jgi:hypothetical protein
MNDNYLIDALRSEQDRALPEFSASRHRRLAATIDRERRRRRRLRLAAPLAACLGLFAAFAVRDAQTTNPSDRQFVAAERAASSGPNPTSGVEILLQRSDRAAAELRERMDLPKWSLDRALDSSRLTRAVLNRLPVGNLSETSPSHDDAPPPTGLRPQAPA